MKRLTASLLTASLLTGSLAALLLMAATTQAQNERDLAVHKDKRQLASDDSWFYDDLDAALDAAAKTKRPLMIVFR